MGILISGLLENGFVNRKRGRREHTPLLLLDDWKKFWQNPMALLEYRFIPLMISVVKIGDELSAAALTRGLDNPAKRSSITRVGFTCYDAIAVVISGVMLFVTLFIIKW